MKVTNQIFEQARSLNGGWNYAQCRVFGEDMKVKGWKKRVMKKDWPDEIVNRFK